MAVQIDALDSRIIRLRQYGDRMTCREIASELEIPETRVYSALRRAGLQWQHRGMDKRSREKVLVISGHNKGA